MEEDASVLDKKKNESDVVNIIGQKGFDYLHGLKVNIRRDFQKELDETDEPTYQFELNDRTVFFNLTEIPNSIF